MITNITMIVIGLLISSTQKKFMVQAQLFVSCSDVELDSGGTVEGCLYNTASPLTVSLTDGSSVTFGTESGIFVYCNPSVARSVDTCVCRVIVNPSDTASASDFCDSCTITAISDTEFDPYFDCSNRLVGDCVGIDSAGLCIDNNVAPAPVRVPVSIPPPTPFPVSAPRATPLQSPTAFPITPMTLAPLTPQSDLPPSTAPTVSERTEMPSKRPVEAPINTSTSNTSGQVAGSSDFTITGVAVGCVGGIVLAALFALLILIIQRKKFASSETSKSATFGDPNAAPIFDDTFSPPRSSGTTLGVSDTTGSTIASLVRPTATNLPLLYPMVNTTFSTPYTTEMLEPQKCEALHPYPVNPLLHVKDQCRAVAFVPVPNPMSLSPADK